MSTSLIRCAAMAVALVATCDGYMPSAAPSRAAAVRPAAASVFMDETVFERALAGELEEEGFENPFMSEVGWADYLDKNAKSSYNMNQRPSLADDGYYTASIVDNPLDVVSDWLGAMKGYVTNPVATAFPTISNDPTGARSYPKGSNEVSARTIKPKEKDFDPKKRIVGIPGFNIFGTPSSKSGSFIENFFGN